MGTAIDKNTGHVIVGVVTSVNGSSGDVTVSTGGIVASDVNYTNLNNNGSVGTGASQVSQGTHTHSGILTNPLGVMNNQTLANAKWVNGFVATAGSQDHTVYTCPSGKRAVVISCSGFNNSGNSRTMNNSFQIAASGTKYGIGSSGAVANGAAFSATTFAVLEATDILICNANGAGVNVWFKILEFDASGASLQNARSLAPGAADNVLYTCPSSKVAYVVNNTMTPATAGSVVVFNNTGGGINCFLAFAPTGTASNHYDDYQKTAAAAVNSSATSSTNLNANTDAILTAGDKLVINAASAITGGIAWALLLELSV